MSGKKQSPDQAFLMGVLCALEILEPHQQDTLYDEIVRTVGEEYLIETARREASMRRSGLIRYLNGKKKGGRG